jgi:hypothetical protein
MRNRERVLRLRVLVVDSLGGIRRVIGRCPTWLVAYPDVDVHGAFEQLEADLTAIDPRRVQVLDFTALPSRPLPEAEFG